MSKREHGFTMLEVMVAMSILSIGIVAVMGLQYIITKGVIDGDVVTNELYLANIIMEQQYKLGGEDKSISLTDVNANGEENKGAYRVEAIVTNPLDSTSIRFVTVRVTLDSNGVLGRPVVYKTLAQQ